MVCHISTMGPRNFQRLYGSRWPTEVPDIVSLPPLGALDIPMHHVSLPPFARHQQILDEFFQSRDADTGDGYNLHSLHLLISNIA